MALPLTEAERERIMSGKSSLTSLAERFNCSRGTISRVKKKIMAGEPTVYIYDTGAHVIRDYSASKFRDAHPDEVAECPIGTSPAVRCQRHLMDLYAVYGEPLRKPQQAVFAPLRVAKK